MQDCKCRGKNFLFNPQSSSISNLGSNQFFGSTLHVSLYHKLLLIIALFDQRSFLVSLAIKHLFIYKSNTTWGVGTCTIYFIISWENKSTSRLKITGIVKWVILTTYIFTSVISYFFYNFYHFSTFISIPFFAHLHFDAVTYLLHI